MSVNAFAARPAGKSIGAAGVGLVATLAVFVIVFVAFLIAPLFLLGAAFVGYLVMRPRQARPERATANADGSVEPTGFGAGAR